MERVWLVNHRHAVQKEARFVALVSEVQELEAHRNQFRQKIIVVVIPRIDAQNSRSGDFCDDDRQN